MSSISSGVDLSVKYQRLAVEYVKVRNQVSVLKSALLEEQSKAADLEKEIALRETQQHKLETERESLLFRNEQLMKRVEGLQESMDAQQAIFGMAKGKKKHKEANLRLVAESSRMHRQALSGGPSSSDPLSVLEGELERKINENSELHSKIFDVERRFDETVAAYTRRIDDLEAENEALKNANAFQSDAKQWRECDICETGSAATGQALLLPGANAEGDGARSTMFVASTDLTEGILDCSRNETDESAVSVFSPCDQQTMDNGIRVPNFANASNSAGEQQTDERAEATAALLDKCSAERISTLGESLQHATGRAIYYKQECEELLRKGICDQQRIENLEQNICELRSKCHSLNDTLETTQSNYEAQLRELHEHLAENEEKMLTNCQNAADRRRPLAPNGGGPNNDSQLQKSKERGEQNGDGKAKKKEWGRPGWFASSSSSSSKQQKG